MTPARYDFGWKFRRDWVRDGIRWFIPPAGQTEARTRRYNQVKLEYVRRRLAGTRKSAYLQDILDQVLCGITDEQRKIEAIVEFVQGATFHNPLECPFEADERTIVSEAHEILELHDARCWHCAEVLQQIFAQAGWDARIAVLPSALCDSVQVVTEVFHDGEWRFTDANYFREGVIVRKPDGSLPTLAWLRRHPHYVDRLPCRWIFTPDYLTNEAEETVRGQFAPPFAEAETTWGYDSYYCYYLGSKEVFPPIAPPALSARRVGGDQVRCEWKPSASRTAGPILYDVTVRRLADRLIVFEAIGVESTHALAEGLDPQEEYQVAVRATDEHLAANADTWYPVSTYVLRSAEF